MSRSKIASQSLLRAKLSSVMKKRRMFCAQFSRMIFSMSSGVRWRRLATLHVDDGAERALERAAAAGVEACVVADRAPHEFMRQERPRRPVDARQVFHVVVDRLQAPGRSVADEIVEPVLRLAGKQRDTHLAGEIEVDRAPIEHREAAGNVEPADRHPDARGTEWPRDIQRPRILVRLHAHQCQQSEIAVLAKATDQLGNVDPCVGLVDHVDVEFDIRPERLPLCAVARQAVDRGERVRGNHPAPPADDVSVIVVVRGFQQNELKPALRRGFRLQTTRSFGQTPTLPRQDRGNKSKAESARSGFR
jgi:hypothetical protein